MSITTDKSHFTPEDLLTLPNGKDYELVNGELVERNMGWNSSYVGGRLHHKLSGFCDAHKVGLVAPGDASYQCFASASEKVRRLDVSFLRKNRVPPKAQREGHCRVHPDMAAEVISPNDSYVDVEEKVREYLEAGVRLVWVINPEHRTVRIHRADGTITDLGVNDELTGEDVIPGFRMRVGELFEGLETAPVAANGPQA